MLGATSSEGPAEFVSPTELLLLLYAATRTGPAAAAGPGDACGRQEVGRMLQEFRAEVHHSNPCSTTPKGISLWQHGSSSARKGSVVPPPPTRRRDFTSESISRSEG